MQVNQCSERHIPNRCLEEPVEMLLKLAGMLLAALSIQLVSPNQPSDHHYTARTIDGSTSERRLFDSTCSSCMVPQQRLCQPLQYASVRLPPKDDDTKFSSFADMRNHTKQTATYLSGSIRVLTRSPCSSSPVIRTGRASDGCCGSFQ